MNKRQPFYVMLIALFTLMLIAWTAFVMQGVLYNLPAWFSGQEWLAIIALIVVVTGLSALGLGRIKIVRRNVFLHGMLALLCTYTVLVVGDFVLNMARDLGGAYCIGLFGVRTNCVSNSWWRFVLFYLPIGVPIVWMTVVSLGYTALTRKKLSRSPKEPRPPRQ